MIDAILRGNNANDKSDVQSYTIYLTPPEILQYDTSLRRSRASLARA